MQLDSCPCRVNLFHPDVQSVWGLVELFEGKLRRDWQVNFRKKKLNVKHIPVVYFLSFTYKLFIFFYPVSWVDGPFLFSPRTRYPFRIISHEKSV